MTDKSILDLTEIMALSPNDYLVVETAIGTRKIKKGNAAIAGRKAPSIVQKATLRGDGNVVLPSAPTVGNLLVHIAAGYSATTLPATYRPTGFTPVQVYQSDVNNAVSLSIRRVQNGDGLNYAVTSQDNQACVLFEFADASGVYGIGGGAMGGFFSGSNFNAFAQLSPYSVDDIVIGAFTQDTTALWNLTAETGLTVDLVTPNDVNNHTGAFFHYDKTFDGSVQGSTSANPTQPAFGMFAVVGAPG